jgi:hypothetical protein
LKRFLFGSKKRLLVTLATLTVVAAAAVGAYAYFSASGTGTSNAVVGSQTGWTVNVVPATAIIPAIYPGQGTDNYKYTVTNSGGGNQQLNTVTIQIANSNGTAWSSQGDGSKPACTAADFSINGGAAGATATDTYHLHYAPGAGPSGISFTVQMVDRQDVSLGDGTGNQDNCQGQHPPILVTAS